MFNERLMSQFLQQGFTIKCKNKTTETDDVMGGTLLRNRRGGRLPQRDHKALLISPALIYTRRIGQVQVGPKETNLIRPNTPRHYELKPPASIVQLNGTVQANILFQELYLISTTSRLRRQVLEYNQISKFALKSKLGEVAVRLKPKAKESGEPVFIRNNNQAPKGGKGGIYKTLGRLK